MYSRKQRQAEAYVRQIRGDIRLRIREALNPIPHVMLVQHDLRQQRAMADIARRVLTMPGEEARVLEPASAREALVAPLDDIWVASFCSRHPHIDTLDLARRIGEASPYVRMVACCRPDRVADLAEMELLGVEPICEEAELAGLFEPVLQMVVHARRWLPEILEARAIGEELATRYDDALIRALGYPVPRRGERVRPLEEVIGQAVQNAMWMTRGNRTEAARLLAIGRQRLYRLLDRAAGGEATWAAEVRDGAKDLGPEER